MESFFSHPLPMTYFPSYSVPPAVPPPGILCRMAKTVYPHWRERRIAAGGKNIIPQLNVRRSPLNPRLSMIPPPSAVV
jgi:enhancer of polycomb-like protein